MDIRVTFFLGQADSCLETSDSLIWLPLEQNSKEQPSIPIWIPLRKLHYLRIHLGQLKTSWENRIQAPSQLKELQNFQTSSKEFLDFRGISDDLENLLLDATGLPIQGLSLLESLSMNLSTLCLRFSTLRGEQASTKRGDMTPCKSLVILNFKFNEELHWDSGKAAMSGLEKLENNGEKFVSKILISGIHYPSLESIKLHYMENLTEVNLTRVKTLNFLDIRNCPNLKTLAATSDLPNLRNSTSVSGTQYLRNVAGSKVNNCMDLIAVDHFNSVSGISDFRMLGQFKISECQELEELWLGHLCCLEKITIENCNHLKYLCFSGMKCLEIITFQTNVMVKYFQLDDCQNLKTIEFSCEELVELSICGCPELEKLPAFKGLNCHERIIIDGCGKLKYLQLYHCRNLKSVSVNSIRCLHVTSCSELEELSCLSRVEKIEICQCEKIQNIRLPKALICLSVEGCTDLQRIGTGYLMKLRKLTIRKCPKLEELSCLSRVDDMEKIEICKCEKIQNIRLPTALIYLSVIGCRDFQRVAGTGDFTKLRELTISNCPELEELPSLSLVNDIQKIEIYRCEKLRNIRLPTTLMCLSVESCRGLQRVAGTGDLMKIRELTITECPELEELPCLSRVNTMDKIEIYQCEKIQNIRLPTILISLSVKSCRDLQTVAGTVAESFQNDLFGANCD
ncbi:uncharacterized protein LOC131856382 [Cryptomeria japonica]|uniref:uncharacterized protein LOC131856382 n=1 Tax=Cryptomeria japonica TaxID=3369 RepID=UPI0027D9D2BA|nr:uncharacterized protein LOC131856382 [Cryptomeria japonica]